MRHLLQVLIVWITSFALLAGCGQAGPPEKATSIRLLDRVSEREAKDYQGWAEQYVRSDPGVEDCQFARLNADAWRLMILDPHAHEGKLAVTVDGVGIDPAPIRFELIRKVPKGEEPSPAEEAGSKGAVTWEGKGTSGDARSWSMTVTALRSDPLLEGEIHGPRNFWEIRPAKGGGFEKVHVVARMRSEELPPCRSDERKTTFDAQPKKAERKKKAQ